MTSTIKSGSAPGAGCPEQLSKLGELKPIKGYKGKYSITKDGRVYGHYRGIWMKQTISGMGYACISLKNEQGYKNKVVHKMVFETFVKEVEEGNQVNHIDGNKLNNNLSNLEEVTRSENCQHAYDTGLKKATNKRAVCQYTLDNKLVQEFQSITKACEYMKSSTGNMCTAIKNNKPHKGFKWKYKEDK